MDDLISRQAAIDAVENIDCSDGVGISALKCEAVDDGVTAIKALPSAQPEPCVDTIDALDESIKHFDDMAEECRRNANIEQNDYMDMRDDAAEYRQLSIWLNELKWLRERFQSQPDLSEYSDKLWKAAYERGKAEAQQRWIPCSERLPDEEVLCCDTRGEMIIGYPYPDEESNTGFSAESDDVFMIDCAAWMPLPKSYRAERRTDEV